MSFRSVVKRVIPQSVFHKIEPLGHLGEAVLAQAINGFPARKLKVIGVTGTDGKTSTSSLITQLLRASGYKVAMLTTISVDYGDGAGEQPNQTRLTTTGAMAMAKTLKKIKLSGAEWLVLETTSHALAQHRVWGVPYTMAVFTNISHEHLDYHGTFENYRAAKKMLFQACNKNKKGMRVGVINADDANADVFINAITHPVTYGIQHGDMRARNIKRAPSGSRYAVKYDGVEYRIECHLPGSFNVYNSLAAVAAGHVLGLTKQEIEHGIASLTSVAGRMSRIDEGQDFEVIVDYAHTPESFEKVFSELKSMTKGRIISMFGSAGRRDEAKRSQQGKIAGQYSEFVVVTEEDDRDCDGQEILQQIADGAREVGHIEDKSLFLIHKREDAVAKAISLAQPGDLVLLLGKGHETNILTNGQGGVGTMTKRPYDEMAVARQAINTKLDTA